LIKIRYGRIQARFETDYLLILSEYSNNIGNDAVIDQKLADAIIADIQAKIITESPAIAEIMPVSITLTETVSDIIPEVPLISRNLRKRAAQMLRFRLC